VAGTTYVKLPRPRHHSRFTRHLTTLCRTTQPWVGPQGMQCLRVDEPRDGHIQEKGDRRCVDVLISQITNHYGPPEITAVMGGCRESQGASWCSYPPQIKSHTVSDSSEMIAGTRRRWRWRGPVTVNSTGFTFVEAATAQLVALAVDPHPNGSAGLKR